MVQNDARGTGKKWLVRLRPFTFDLAHSQLFELNFGVKVQVKLPFLPTLRRPLVSMVTAIWTPMPVRESQLPS